MSNVVEKKIDGIQLGFAKESSFTEKTLQSLAALMREPRLEQTSPLGGRNCISVGEVEGVGRVVVKQYMRGGLLRSLIRRRYIGLGTRRSAVEFALLKEAQKAGVAVPEPVAYGHSGSLFYRAWLVTKEVPNRRTMAEVAVADDDALSSLMNDLVRQVGILIRNRIFHVDLHPGNVIVEGDHTVYLLDFDKAYQFKGAANVLRDRYLHRWRRAVIKHQLPEILSELMSHGLRASFE